MRTVQAEPRPVPRPRRFTVTLGVAASVGVVGTSLRSVPPGALWPLTAAWLGLFAAGALWIAGGRVVLIVLAGAVKAVTATLAVWAVTHSASPVGPHTVLDWVPLGALNAATGIWLYRVIRHQAR